MDRYDPKYKKCAHELIEQLAGMGKTVEEARWIFRLANEELKRITNGQEILTLRRMF